MLFPQNSHRPWPKMLFLPNFPWPSQQMPQPQNFPRHWPKMPFPKTLQVWKKTPQFSFIQSNKQITPHPLPSNMLIHYQRPRQQHFHPGQDDHTLTVKHSSSHEERAIMKTHVVVKAVAECYGHLFPCLLVCDQADGCQWLLRQVVVLENTMCGMNFGIKLLIFFK